MTLDRASFVDRFGQVFEHSPWIAEQAFDRFALAEPLTAARVHEALCSVFRSAGRDQRMAVIQAHPDLAGKLARAGRLTASSTSEQRSAGLDLLTDDERDRFTQLNETYRNHFGFPFVIAVKGLDKCHILGAFERRLGNDRDKEIEEACRQIERIVYLRLKDLLP